MRFKFFKKMCKNLIKGKCIVGKDDPDDDGKCLACLCPAEYKEF